MRGWLSRACAYSYASLWTSLAGSTMPLWSTSNKSNIRLRCCFDDVRRDEQQRSRDANRDVVPQGFELRIHTLRESFAEDGEITYLPETNSSATIEVLLMYVTDGVIPEETRTHEDVH